MSSSSWGSVEVYAYDTRRAAFVRPRAPNSRTRQVGVGTFPKPGSARNCFERSVAASGRTLALAATRPIQSAATLGSNLRSSSCPARLLLLNGRVLVEQVLARCQVADGLVDKAHAAVQPDAMTSPPLHFLLAGLDEGHLDAARTQCVPERAADTCGFCSRSLPPRPLCRSPRGKRLGCGGDRRVLGGMSSR